MRSDQEICWPADDFDVIPEAPEIANDRLLISVGLVVFWDLPKVAHSPCILKRAWSRTDVRPFGSTILESLWYVHAGDERPSRLASS